MLQNGHIWGVGINIEFDGRSHGLKTPLGHIAPKKSKFYDARSHGSTIMYVVVMCNVVMLFAIVMWWIYLQERHIETD